jgi:hypothetical protein
MISKERKEGRVFNLEKALSNPESSLSLLASPTASYPSLAYLMGIDRVFAIEQDDEYG